MGTTSCYTPGSGSIGDQGTTSVSSWVRFCGLLSATLVAYPVDLGYVSSVRSSHTWTQPASQKTASPEKSIKAPNTNRYVPKTSLGKRLLALREAAIREGMELVPVEKIISDVEAFRG